MAKQLKVGDKVKIKKSSEYFKENTPYNPQGVVGTVIDTCQGSSHTIRVEWPGSKRNSYRLKDLKLAVEKAPKENLLAEINYTDCCDDVLEVDTTMRSHVYISAGELDSDGDFDSSKSIEVKVEQVKKLRKQLKAWLDKHHPTA